MSLPGLLPVGPFLGGVAPGVAPGFGGIRTKARKANGKRSVSRDGSVRVHGKASNGEGSVYLDADGSWRATYVAPGSARPKRVRGKTREEAIARRAVKLEELSQIQSSTFHRDATVAELAEWWLDVVARHRVRRSTLGTYSQRVERITNTIGQLPARSLKPQLLGVSSPDPCLTAD